MNRPRPVVAPDDERRHQPGAEPLWSESWYFDFVAPDGSLGGWVRLGLYPGLGVSWYHALLVGRDRPTISVAELAGPLPPGEDLTIRAEGLWAEQLCQTPLDHWTVANEAFGLAVDDPADLLAPEPRGALVPVGFDLEWEDAAEPFHYEVTSRYEVPCEVHGEILVGAERIDFAGHGQRDHSWGVRDWWTVGWTWSAGRLADGTAFHGVEVRLGPEVLIPFGYVTAPGGAGGATGAPVAATVVRADAQLGPHGFPTSATIAVQDLVLAVEPLAFAPAHLVGPTGAVAHLVRALCRFTAADGRTGHGWAEWNQPQP